ncbi:MAG: DUF6542 domain-containing protein [Jatrophihabitantaceae bacterium]
MVNAPVPHGARRPLPTPRTGEAAGDEWGQSTPVRAAYLGNPPAVASLPKAAERGLPGWAGLLVLLGIAGLGGLIDTLSGSQVRGGFNIGIVVASIVAMLVGRRSAMFPVAIAPPLVYSGASATMLYLRSGGLHDKRVLFDGAANWLVYGFPAIAGATAAVLIIAGVRLVTHR